MIKDSIRHAMIDWTASAKSRKLTGTLLRKNLDEDIKVADTKKIIGVDQF